MTERDGWENHYVASERPPWDTGRPSAEMIRRMTGLNLSPCRSLEIGCGTGTNAIWLAQRGFDVTAVDISPTAISRAENKAKTAKLSIRFVAGDITESLDLGEPFPFFFDRGCYHAIRRNNVGGFLKALDRLTAKGAFGIVLTGNSHEIRKPGPPTVSEKELRSELGRLFTIVDLNEFRFDQDEPDEQFLGWSCLLQKR